MTTSATPSVLDDLEMQFLLFGYAVSGAADELAWVCEIGQDPPSGALWWDRRASDLVGTRVTADGKAQPIPLWWALPGVVAHELQRPL